MRPQVKKFDLYWVILFVALTTASSAEESRARAVWIALRADHAPGTGRRADPFDAGTQEQLDALMPRIEPNTRIHFGAGTFVTRGIRAKEGWRISGLGKDRTTIKLAAGIATESNDTNYAVIWKYFDNDWLRYFEMSELTLDCNRATQPVFLENRKGAALDAYLIAAKSARITNVRALGTWANPGEGFPCVVMHDGSDYNDDRIEISGVENINPIGYLSAIGAIDQNGGAVTGFIKDCLVTDHLNGTAFGASASRNFKIYNNTARNVAIGVTFDTFPARNLDIFGNRFHNVTGWGVLFNNGSVLKNVKIHDNLIEMTPNAGAVFVGGQVSASVRIYRNRVVQPNPSGGIINGSPKLTGQLRDNVIQTAGPFETNSVPNLLLSGNCDFKGKLLRPTYYRHRLTSRIKEKKPRR